MQSLLKEFDAAGANLVAITPQLPEHSVTMASVNDLGFDLLTDFGSEFSASLGLRFKLPENLQKLYQEFGIDLPKYNNESSWTLPIPARLIVDQDNVVRYIDADPDYTFRPEPTEILRFLRSLAL